MTTKLTGPDLEQKVAIGAARTIGAQLRDDPLAATAARLAAAEGLAVRIHEARFKMGDTLIKWDDLPQQHRNMALACAADVLNAAAAESTPEPVQAPPTDQETHDKAVSMLRMLVLNGAVAAHNLVLRAGAAPDGKDSPALGKDNASQACTIADTAYSIGQTVEKATQALALMLTCAPLPAPAEPTNEGTNA